MTPEQRRAWEEVLSASARLDAAVNSRSRTMTPSKYRLVEEATALFEEAMEKYGKTKMQRTVGRTPPAPANVFTNDRNHRVTRKPGHEES